MFSEKPKHLTALGDPRGPLARMVGAGAAIVAVAVALLLYAAQGESTPAPEPAEPDAEATPVALGAETASLWVDAPSSGAAVYVDGVPVGIVPLWADSLAFGLRRIEVVTTDGRALVDTTVSVLAGDVIDLDLGGDQRRRAEAFAAVTTTDRAEADRTTPVTPRPPAEEAQRAPQTAPARPAPRPAPPPREPRPARQERRPPPPGGLRVTSTPSGAGVRLDGQLVGETPLTLRDLRPGAYELVVGAVGYESAARQVQVRSERVAEAAVPLRRFETQVATRTDAPRARPDPPPAPRGTSSRTGTVEVLVRPWGRIVIDGTTHQRETDVVYRTVLSAGEHRVTASHPQLGSATRTVTVPADGVLRVEIDLAQDGR